MGSGAETPYLVAINSRREDNEMTGDAFATIERKNIDDDQQ